MERFQVGRPSVREAMQSLKNMGLISINHGERARVSLMDAESMIGQLAEPARFLLSTSRETREHLKDARRFFEAAMVREATEKATEEDIRDLENILGEQQQKKEVRYEFVQTDMAFHRKLAAISGNPICAAVSEALLDWLGDYYSDLACTRPGWRS